MSFCYIVCGQTDTMQPFIVRYKYVINHNSQPFSIQSISSKVATSCKMKEHLDPVLFLRQVFGEAESPSPHLPGQGGQEGGGDGL